MTNRVTRVRRVAVVALAVAMCLAMSQAVFAGTMNKNGAIKKALSDAGLTKSEVTELETNYEHGCYEVEFTKGKNKAEYEYKIAKKSGTIMKKEVEYKCKKVSGKKIGKKAARKKTAKFFGFKQKVVKNGTCKYDSDDHEYEIKFTKGSYKYKVELQSSTGKIKEYSKKYIK